MKARKSLCILFLLLLASMAVTVSFRTASMHKPTRAASARQAEESWRTVDRQPSPHLVEAALRKADFPQMMNSSERAAMHRPVQFNGTTIIPDHSLLVEAIPVVEDPGRTWDPCLQLHQGDGGTQTGVWTFNELMLAIAGTTDANPQPAEQMLTNVLAYFAKPVQIGNYTAPARASGMNFFNAWPLDPNGLQCTNPFNTQQQITCKSLAKAPVHLNAIVNRVDIGRDGNSDNAGQLRFVFGVTMDTTDSAGNQCEGAQVFNMILEYTVPPATLSNGFTAQSWAQAWQALSNDCPGGFTNTCAQGTNSGFDFDLEAIVNRVVGLGMGGPGTVNGKALFDLRTNEAELGTFAIWEMRQFQLQTVGTTGTLVETTVPQTPDISLDGGMGTDFNGNPITFCGFFSSMLVNESAPCGNLTTVRSLVQLNKPQLLAGTFSLPSTLQAVSALNGPTAAGQTQELVYWDSDPSMSNMPSLADARVIFAASPQLTDAGTPGGIDGTCNGCHGQETQVGFQQVVNRAATGTGDQPSQLSAFLVGCTSNPPGGLTGPCPGQDLVPLNQASGAAGVESVQDRVFTSQANFFGEIQRRFNCMNKVLNNSGNVSCNGGGN
ncbi:MAG TPA: hypothetical protein VFB04_09125 [Terriglobales bacterium]|nr:hypothetical protein [Terriglobales bacterium]